MRLLLFIPAFILFLANIPFEVEMKMDEQVCKMMMEEEFSCEKGMNEAKPSCHKPETPKEKSDKESCNPSMGLTCICVCCFAYTAPASTSTTINFYIIPQEITLTGFIHSIWEDPQLSPPWQPPDLV